MKEATELKSVVLAGGASRRMKADKAFLSYHGEPQVRFLARALSRLTDTVCISVRREQTLDATLEGLNVLPDRQDNVGPLEGLLSAFSYDPFAAWLAVAVDMPCVTERTLQRLASSRDTSSFATAFRNPYSGLPEPVLAIYEPAILPLLNRAKLSGKYSLMLLCDVPVHLIEAESAGDLLNVNNPTEYREYRRTCGTAGRKD
jgi:molybdopterin-guanine dinucleotide biosynthesis protein A